MTTIIHPNTHPCALPHQAVTHPEQKTTEMKYTRYQWHCIAEQAKREYYGVLIGTYQSFAMRLPGSWKLDEYKLVATRFQEAKMLKDTGHKDAAEYRLTGWPIQDALELEQAEILMEPDR